MNQYMNRRNFLTGVTLSTTGSLLVGCEASSLVKQSSKSNYSLSLLPGRFTREDFTNFIRLRYGDGDPVYWYGVGDASTFPKGKMFMRTEGYDTGRLYSFDSEKSEAVGLTRKLVVLRDPKNGEILKGPKGEPAWLNNFTYQLFRMRLEKGYLVYEVEQGAGPFINTVIDGFERSEVQRYDGMTVYTTPVNYSMPDITGTMRGPVRTAGNLQVWENYDFIEREHAGNTEYSAQWSGVFPLPPFMGPGRSTMHGYFQRYDNYDDVPATLRDFVEEYAPMWKAPPVDMEEIRSLQ
ncbi:MAG: hypothetical protein VYA80_08590 [Pseudomonadota bacterium]|nr:hypothetical protein [Pseudomonadota bacterium]